MTKHWLGIVAAGVLMMSGVVLGHHSDAGRYEDTLTTVDELEVVFGYEIANIVAECTDDKSLPKLARKQAQIDHAAKLSHKAKLVKLADKIANVNDINGAPPAGWSLERKREYYDWAKKVVDQMRGTHAELEALFDAEYAKRP